MTATVGPHPCLFRPTATRIWTTRWRTRGVPLLPWEEELPHRQQLPSASLRLPLSALPTMRKCSPFCRPTWMSWPELTNMRWPSRHGKALLKLELRLPSFHNLMSYLVKKRYVDHLKALYCEYINTFALQSRRGTCNFIHFILLIVCVLHINGQCLSVL